MTNTYDPIIIGGGMGGSMLAGSMAESGLRVLASSET
jgi:choline dehydrogenase-like flavoprotein